MARVAFIWLTVALVVIVVMASALYLNRRAAARQVLVGWLDQRGIKADVEVETLELNGFVGRIRIGDPARPDVTVERVEVDYAIAGPWATGGLAVTPSRIRLLRPVVRATWADGKLSFGSLDPLIDEFTGKPPRPDSRSPLVIVEGGRLNLTSEYGPVQVLADARVDNGKLMRLHAVMPAAALKSGEMAAEGFGGAIDLTTSGERIALAIDLGGQTLRAGMISGKGLRLRGTGDLPYPDLKTHKGDGRAVANLTLVGERLGLGDSVARGVDLRLAFDGQTSGWIDSFRLAGRTDATLKTSAVTGSALQAGATSLAIRGGQASLARTAGALEWSVRGPTALRAATASAGGLSFADLEVQGHDLMIGGRDEAWEATGPMGLSARRATFDELALSGVTGAFDLDATQQGSTLVQAFGSLRSTGGSWPLFGPVKSDDVPELIEMKRALGDFAVSVPAIRLITGSTGTQVTLSQAARLTPANGGVLTILPVARPIFSAEPGQLGGGALNLTATRGRGLPQATVAIPDWRLTPGGFSAHLDAKASLDFGIARGLNLTTSGLLATDRGVLTYTSTTCAPFTADSLELGENDVTRLSGRFCPDGRSIAEVSDGSWRADGRIADVAASAPFLDMNFDQAAGSVAVKGNAAGLGLEAKVATARVLDALTPRRFNPLNATGSASLKDEIWTGGFDVSSGEHALAHVALTHNGLTEIGGVVIDAPAVTFVPGGLQPSALTPLTADFVKSPVSGSVTFAGRFDWDPKSPLGSSSGRLTLPGLDFVSPAGPVKGLTGTIDFTSLAPLITAPDQTVTVATLETVTPLTDLTLKFGLAETTITVGGGKINAAGGTVSVEPFSVPLDQTQGFSGVIVFDRVQLGDLIKGSGFEDKVSLDAVVSGRLPFVYDPKAGVRITQGTLAAAQPGRLSIQREALTGLEAGGGGDVPPSTVEDLAYQAMQNLAFDMLSADVNSLDGGRVSVLFHIKGRHDPPQRQELRLTIPELISRKFLNRPLPLPSNTGIDLTLDTTLNLNQLVSDLLEVNRQRGGGAATPAAVSEPAPASPTPVVTP